MPAKNQAVFAPNLGLYKDRPSLAIPKGGIEDCLNVRVKEGRIARENMGWSKFLAVPLNGPVTGIHNFFPRAGGQLLIFGTPKDLYLYDEGAGNVDFLSPRYETGTVDVTNGSAVVDGTGTTWTTNLKAGDQFHSGAVSQVDPTVVWYEILTVDSDIQITLTANYAEATLTGQAYTARKLFTGDVFDPWIFESFADAIDVVGTDGDRLYATNGVDDLVGFGSTDTQVYIPVLGITAVRAIRRYKNMLIYIGFTDAGQKKPFSIRNSAIGEPENMTSKEASEFVVHDGTDALVGGFVLADTLVLYGQRSIVNAQFTDPIFLFVFRTIISGIGALSARSIADFGDFHEFIGADSLYRYDGVRVTEIGAHLWRDILRRLTPNRTQLAQAHFDEENGEVLWVIPLNTDADTEAGPPELAYSEHYLELVGDRNPTPFAVRELPATAMGYFDRETTLRFSDISDTWADQNYRWDDRFFQAAFPFNLYGDNTGNVFILNDKDDQDGGAISAFVRFPMRPVVDGRSKGLIKRLYPFMEHLPGAAYDLTVKVFATERIEGKIILLDEQAYDLAQDDLEHYFISVFKIARYAQIQFETVGATQPWATQGYDWDAIPAGSR